MSTLSVELNKIYDSDADVLYISVGKPRPAISKAVKDCDSVLIRYDMNTKEVCGATIIDFSKFDKNYLQDLIPIKNLTL